MTRDVRKPSPTPLFDGPQQGANRFGRESAVCSRSSVQAQVADADRGERRQTVVESNDHPGASFRNSGGTVSDLTHIRRSISDPSGWLLFQAMGHPKRLVIFVHGFKGHVTKTWGWLPYAGGTNPWLRESDLLFVTYDSTRERVTATEARLRRALPDFFPRRYNPGPASDSAETQSELAYTEVVIVAHSLGGLVVRRALTELAADGERNEVASALLGASVRLFSPAIAGFEPAGILGALVRAPIVDRVFAATLHASPSFNDLKAGSEMVRNTRSRTEHLAPIHPEWPALQASILWANPEHIVCTEKYDTDPSPYVFDGRGHVMVCKPAQGDTVPLKFIELGSI